MLDIKIKKNNNFLNYRLLFNIEQNMEKISEPYTRLVNFDNHELFSKIILEQIVKIKKYLLIGTYNLQDIRLNLNNKFISLSDVLINLANKGVIIYFLIQPRAYKTKLITKLRNNIKNGNLRVKSCSRIHLKTIIIDLKLAYLGSANLTGFGLGTRSAMKRNFEIGLVTTEESLIAQITRNFLNIFDGKYCNKKTCYYYNNFKSKRPCYGINHQN